MNLRKAFFQPRDQVKKILERKIGVQSADNVKLCDRFAVSRCCRFERLLKRHGVGAGSALFSSESTKAAGCNANIGWIDMAVYIEVGLVAMHALANVIGQPPDGEDICRAI